MSPLPGDDGELGVLLWNVAWRRPASPAGAVIRDLLARHAPDIACLTETSLDLPVGGHVIASDPYYGMPMKPGRRKVLLWSRHPWEQVDALGHPDLPSGRFVRGVTATPLGRLAVIGVCIPWSMAHVGNGRRDRAPWEDHRRYLRALGHWLAEQPPQADTLLLGDFNQAIPRRRAPRDVATTLAEALGPTLEVATAGEIAGLERPSIDHLATTADLATRGIAALPNALADGGRISDHTGLLIRLARPASGGDD
ncbi:endonuclease/exonuclease/phosphatase family protein [Ancylobacter sonchi]|uniref:endonuclease/exonuclease/phosphatase family protein n=1 Tax=Ancylobacter sonchi TaxID=1937790 RepID=UPI001BD678CF|nr:endonuclease/exonuclease/phosphatase family protein [Ancylobacter sonchi]MBS7536546.1 endonuclease/exonuclease/phosphatase family protein [Ancylobacter sonchi]